MKKIVVILVIVAVAAAGLLLLKKRKQAMIDSPLPAPAACTVRTIQAETKTVSQVRAYLAKVESVNRAVVASKINGQVVKLFVRENQSVKKGDLLVSIDDREIKAGIAALQAKYEAALKQSAYAETIYTRNKGLYDAGGLALEKFESSEVAFSTARGVVLELEQNIIILKSQLDYCHIKAASAGVVGTVFLHPGDFASLGKPVLSLNSRARKLTFRFVQDGVSLHPGMEVLLQGVRLGTIAALYDDAEMGLWVAEVSPDRQIDYPSGSYLTIEVVIKSGSGCAVPVTALLHREQGVSVMTYQNNRFSEQSVDILVPGRNFVLIESCPDSPVAVASEAKLTMLPACGAVQTAMGGKDE
jgi:RND family efflux transporter MFP subunit